MSASLGKSCRRQFSDADLTGVVFNRANVSGVNFDGANLSKADFTGADYRLVFNAASLGEGLAEAGHGEHPVDRRAPSLPGR